MYIQLLKPFTINNAGSDYFAHNSVRFLGQNPNDIFIKSGTNFNTKDEIIDYLLKEREKNFNSDDKWVFTFMKLQNCKENDYIRNCIKKGYSVNKLYTRYLDNVLSGRYISADFNVYRGCTLEDFGYETTDEKNIHDFFKKDKVVTAPTYLSTSLDKDIAKKFPWDMKENQKLLFKININSSARGVYLENMLNSREKKEVFYDFDDEEEVFIDRNLRLKMKNKYEEDGFTVIEFDAVGHADNPS